MNTIKASRRGKNYVGTCPVCNTQNLAIATKQLIYHCFFCGIGGPLTGAARDVMRAMFMDLNEDKFPEHIDIPIAEYRYVVKAESIEENPRKNATLRP